MKKSRPLTSEGILTPVDSMPSGPTPIICKNVRYHLVMPNGARRGLSMQDMDGGDNNRTPVVFQVPESLFSLESNVKITPKS